MMAMNKSKMLRQSIEAALHNAADISYCYRYALPTVKPPFCVYSFNLLQTIGCVEQYDLMLDLSGVGLTGADVDEIADKIAAHMDYLVFTDTTQSWSCYLSSRQAIEDKDVSIQRRRLNFELRYVSRMED